MYTVPTFVAHVEAAKTMEPGQRAFHNPTRATEPTSMGRSALRELAVNSAAVQCVAMWLRVVAAVALNQLRLAHRATGTAPKWRNRINQRQ